MMMLTRKLARPYEDFPDHMKGDKIKTILKEGSAAHLLANNSLHIISLPLVIPALYRYELYTRTTNVP
eukprot:3656070-Ditylum_brightwellii.AAC.1